MKLLLLADVNSSHTQKWILEYKDRGISLGLFSLSLPDVYNIWDKTDIELFCLPQNINQNKFNSDFLKISYLKTLPYLKRIIRIFSPDIIHSHYITSYGLLAVLSGFHPIVLSAWGSDVMIFPKKSIFHKFIIKFILKKADYICVTSGILKKEISSYTSKEIAIISFGIDCNFFKPDNSIKGETFIILTLKALEKIYGIDIALKAFSRIHEKYPDKKKKILVAGKGSQLGYLEQLSRELKIDHITDFIGHRSVNEIPALLNQISVLVNVSHGESFGVAVLEASACEKCVVATNVGGLPEVVDDNVTGLLVSPNNIDELENVLGYLLLNPDKCIEMGKNGRKKVISEYDLSKSVDKYLTIYNNLLKVND